MKTFPLSTAKERITGIIFSVIMCAVIIGLLYVLRNNLSILILAALCAIVIIAVLLLYVFNVTKAVCIADPETKTIYVKGFKDRTIDLSAAAQLETIMNKTGHVESRSLAFTDAQGNVVAIVPTYFTSKRGFLAEPMAKELANAFGLNFQANVPLWEYDEEARKAHDIEVAQQEKEAAKARREANKAKRVAKIRRKMAAYNNEKKS